MSRNTKLPMGRQKSSETRPTPSLCTSPGVRSRSTPDVRSRSVTRLSRPGDPFVSNTALPGGPSVLDKESLIRVHMAWRRREGSRHWYSNCRSLKAEVLRSWRERNHEKNTRTSHQYTASKVNSAASMAIRRMPRVRVRSTLLSSNWEEWRRTLSSAHQKRWQCGINSGLHNTRVYKQTTS